MPSFRTPALAMTWQAALMAALCVAPLQAAAAAATGLKPAAGLDMTRAGRTGEEDRRALRDAWRTGQFRADESVALDDILARLGRIEVTTHELFRIIERMPSRPAAAMPPPAVTRPAAEAPSRAEAGGIPLSLLVQAGVAALALAAAFAILRRRQAAISLPAFRSEPAHAPGHEPAAVAVPPAPTIVPPPTTDDWPHPPNGGLFRLDREDATDSAQDAGAVQDEQDTLDLADIMLSMGQAQGAAGALTEYISAHPRQALHHWLKLLDVYRRSGNRFQFEKSARELRERFNVQAESWARLTSGETAQLEAYPRVAEQVVRTWPATDEALAYLARLLEDNRGGTRAGFPQPVAEDILLLIAVLKAR